MNIGDDQLYEGMLKIGQVAFYHIASILIILEKEKRMKKEMGMCRVQL